MCRCLVVVNRWSQTIRQEWREPTGRVAIDWKPDLSFTDDTLVYGPAEERFWGFPTDDMLQTTAPGLFVAGDGAGQSQGIIQASVAGLLAGAGMARALEGAGAG